MSNSERSVWGVKLGATALLLAVFAAGAVSGAVFYRWSSLDDQCAPGPLPPGKIGWMLHELNLTTAQEAQAQAVFERHRPKLDRVLRETFPKVRAVQDEIDAELEKLLTPKQAQTFTEMRKRRPPPGAPMGPGGFGRMPPPPDPMASPPQSELAPTAAPLVVPAGS